MTPCSIIAARRFGPGAVLALAIACGDGTGPGPIGGAVQRLAIVPGALLLTAPGDTVSLRVVGIEADGDTISLADAVTWQSSQPGMVAVSDVGVATAGAFGSSVITAQSGALTSAPVLALVAQPAGGALLVSDAQVVGDIVPVDPLAPYEPGWEYRVRLRGVSPVVGQVVLASGGAPVGGRVVSVSPAGGDNDVVLELLPLSGMFENLSVNVQLSLDDAALAEPQVLRAGPVNASAESRAAGRRIEKEFDIGNFECKAEIPPAFVFPLTLDAVDVDVDPQLTLDVVIDGSVVKKLVAHGSVAARLSANPLVTAALEAKAECLHTVRLIILPIGGPVSLIIGGQIPVGVGVEVGAKATFGQLGFDAFYQASLTTEFGIDCTAVCEVVAEMTTTPPEGFFKPKIPTFADDLRFDLTGSAFGFAKLTIGNPLIRDLRFETVELKAGIEQKFELAGLTAQANDPAYASTYTLKPVLEFKTSSKLDAVANLLGITLAELSFAPDLPVISESPRGTFSISPGSVAAGNESALGETATFTITLDPVDYFGAYAVETVDIFRRVGPAGPLEPGRPGCTRVEAAQDQTEFICQADFLEEHVGSQEFFAFANTRIYGVPVPVPLEVGVNGKATVEVTAGGTLAWEFSNDLEGWSPMGSAIQLDREGGVVKLDGVGDPGVPNASISRTIVLPATASTLRFRTSAHDRDGADAALRVRLETNGQSTTLLDWEVLAGAEDVFLWHDRNVSLAPFAGQTVTLFFEQDDDGEGSHEQRYLDFIRIAP